VRSNPQAAGIDITPMVYGGGRRHETTGSNEVRHARENVACRESIGRKSKIVSIDFRAVPPEAGRIHDGDDVIDGVSQCRLLDGNPRQLDKDVPCAMDLQRIGEQTKRTFDLQEVSSAHDPARLQYLSRLLACQGGIATDEQLRDPLVPKLCCPSRPVGKMSCDQCRPK
jgi:hypothetical protein